MTSDEGREVGKLCVVTTHPVSPTVSRGLCAGLFLVAGALHFIVPGPYRSVVPAWLPRADLLVAVSGAAELAGSAGLLLPRWRRAAGWGLLLLLVAVFPANVEMLRLGRARGVGVLAETLLWLRLPLQLLLMLWVWRVSRPAGQR